MVSYQIAWAMAQKRLTGREGQHLHLFHAGRNLNYSLLQLQQRRPSGGRAGTLRSNRTGKAGPRQGCED